MSILIRQNSKSHLVAPDKFKYEIDLELLLSECPDLLLMDDGETDIQFVARQVILPDAGKLDLLFVDGKGVLIAVETKLASNAESRREVVAQVIDYLSSLTSLTVDELNRNVNGKLELALRALTAADDDSEFDLLWDKVGTNLRNGLARLVVALDYAPPDLQRIFRFLARKSDLDVQLMSVQRYSSSSVGEVFVPQILVSPESVDRPSRGSNKEQHSELVAVFDAYNASAPQDIRAVGEASDYRLIRPSDWLGRKKLIGYSFRWKPNAIRVELSPSHKISSTSAEALALAEVLSQFNRTPISNGYTLSWDKDYHSGKGRLFVQFPLTTPSETVAQAMRDLIALTRLTITQKLKVLADKPEVVTVEQGSA